MNSYISLDTDKLKINIYSTTRKNGFSSAQYDAFNLSYDVDDDPNKVLLNRNKLCNDLHIEPFNLIILSGKASNDKIVEIKDISDGREAGAILTKNQNLSLGIINNDYSPILIYSEEQNLICIIRSTINNAKNLFTKKVINSLKKDYKVNPNTLHVFFGPGMGFFHIEGDESSFNIIRKNGYGMSIKRLIDVDYIDINLLNYMQLVDCGIKPDNISINEYDIFDDPNFFCKKRDGLTGRSMSIINFKK